MSDAFEIPRPGGLRHKLGLAFGAFVAAFGAWIITTQTDNILLMACAFLMIVGGAIMAIDHLFRMLTSWTFDAEGITAHRPLLGNKTLPWPRIDQVRLARANVQRGRGWERLIFGRRTLCVHFGTDMWLIQTEDADDEVDVLRMVESSVRKACIVGWDLKLYIRDHLKSTVTGMA